MRLRLAGLLALLPLLCVPASAGTTPGEEEILDRLAEAIVFSAACGYDFDFGLAGLALEQAGMRDDLLADGSDGRLFFEEAQDLQWWRVERHEVPHEEMCRYVLDLYGPKGSVAPGIVSDGR